MGYVDKQPVLRGQVKHNSKTMMDEGTTTERTMTERRTTERNSVIVVNGTSDGVRQSVQSYIDDLKAIIKKMVAENEKSSRINDYVVDLFEVKNLLAILNKDEMAG